ncbi:MAG TPA: phage tail tip lysozyme [Kofleriaceae bacterium]|nr:phage tail tip lysozyme [Kofleriaceae bacterium]
MKLAILLVLAGCATDPALDTDQQAATTSFANDKAAFDFFVAKGLTPAQSAGIVGNLDQESGVDPASVQYGGGPGRGIAQWSVGGRWDTSAGDNVTAYASQQGMSRTSLNLQLEFIWFELTHIGYGYSDLKAATNVTDATLAFMDKYEICGTCASAQRIAYAKDVLAAYGNDAVYSATYVSQSWPLATMALTIHCGESVPAQIVLKNSGTKTWDGNTKLGTTEPRDRDSMFAGADWPAPNRAAAIAGTVAPGANGTFDFSFTAPSGDACVPGTYHEHFGLVQEATTWFADSGGGPPDDQIEAQLVVVPADPGAGSGSDYTGGGSAGDGGGDGGAQMAAGCSAGSGNVSWLVLVGLAFARRRRQRC